MIKDKKATLRKGLPHVESEDAIPFLSENLHSAASDYQSIKSSIASKPSCYGNTESHQYEPDESEVWRHHQLLRLLLLLLKF